MFIVDATDELQFFINRSNIYYFDFFNRLYSTRGTDKKGSGVVTFDVNLGQEPILSRHFCKLDNFQYNGVDSVQFLNCVAYKKA
jgi:hypothetical protein